MVEDYAFPNKGILTCEDRKVTVKGAFPGEKIQYRVTKKKAGKAEGALLAVLEKSELEDAEPMCPHFGACGGCTYQTMSYRNQLKVKKKLVKKLLDSVVQDYEFLGIFGSPEQAGYRNKMEFTFGDAYKDGPLTLGLHKKGSFYDILEVTDCKIVKPGWNEILKFTQAFFAERKVPYYHRMKHTGVLRNLVIRQSSVTGEYLINLVTTGLGKTGEGALSQESLGEGASDEGTMKEGMLKEETLSQEDLGEGASDEGTLKESSLKEENPSQENLDESAVDEGILSQNVLDEETSDEGVLDEEMLQQYVAGLLKLEADGKLNSPMSFGRIAGILHTENDSLADIVQSDRTTVLYGEDFLIEEVMGLKFRISPFSFFQTNTKGCEVLYKKVREFVAEANGKTGTDVESEVENSAETELNGEIDDMAGIAEGIEADSDTGAAACGKEHRVIFDLYSGTGTIAQMLAPVAEKVIGIEIVEEAVEAARQNAEINGLTNCEFIAGDVLKVLDEIPEKPDFIVLDPPRDGIHPKALPKIISYGVENIVYISCKPTSLVRDLAVFQENGYRVVKACAVDQFPGTVHVETVVLLSQRKPDDVIEVEIELGEMDLTSAESKATYAEIKDYVLKEHGLKVSNLYISQVKRKCGIEVGENYNLPKSEDSRQPQCPEEKEKAIKDALDHFGMI